MYNSIPLEKVAAPDVPPAILHRTLLVDYLYEATGGNAYYPALYTSWRKLILLCAPAGYGKTTLLADFARSRSFTCCWMQLDSCDSNPITFLALMVASIRHQFPDVGASLAMHLSDIAADVDTDTPPDTLLEKGWSFVERMSSLLKEQVEDRFMLVLCNYDAVNEKEPINALVERLLDRLPRQCILCVESRALPQFDFAPLIAHQQVIRLGIEHLRFSTQQIYDLAQLLSSATVSLDQAQELATVYEGWITGILLGTHLSMVPLPPWLTNPNSSLEAASFEMRQQPVFFYLVSQVFKQREHSYTFIRDLAIFPSMLAEECNMLLSIQDAESYLENIERQGLFVTHRRENGQNVYVCHPILRELLLHDLSQHYPDRLQMLQHQAARIFSLQGKKKEAVMYAILAGDYDYATQLIVEIASPPQHKIDSQTLLEWIGELPEMVLEKNSALLLIYANSYLMQYDLQKATQYINKAIEALERTAIDQIENNKNMKAEIYLVKGTILFQTGEYQSTQQLCQEILNLVPIDEHNVRERAYQLLGACACLLGNCHRGILYLQQALHLCGHDTQRRQTALLHMYLANAYNIIGNYTLAEHHRVRSIEGFEYLNDFRGKIHGLIGMGNTKHLQGLLVEAQDLFQQALQLAHERQFLSGEAYALLNLGEVCQDQGDDKQALSILEDGFKCTEHMHDTYLRNCLLGNLARTYLYLADTDSASLLIDKMEFNTVAPNSVENALYTVLRGMILYAQKRYGEAQDLLILLDDALESTDLKQLHLRTLLYRAACHLAQSETQQMFKVIERIDTLAQENHSEHFVKAELNRLSPLRCIIYELPQINWLHEHAAALSPQQLGEPKPQITQFIAERTIRTTRLQVFALGEPQVFIDGAPITHWRMERSKELFYFLLHADRPMHKEQIMAALWPEGGEHSEQNMRTIVYHLRRTIGERCVPYRGGTYELQLQPYYSENVWYDVTLFQRYAMEAKELKEENMLAATELYQQMVSLYKGDYISSFYHDWSRDLRRQLRNYYLEAHRELALFYLDNGQYEESQHHWQRILKLDNCQEMAYEGSIRCYLNQGKRGPAIQQYRQCVETLRKELGVAPGPILQQLYRRLIARIG